MRQRSFCEAITMCWQSKTYSFIQVCASIFRYRMTACYTRTATSKCIPVFYQIVLNANYEEFI